MIMVAFLASALVSAIWVVQEYSKFNRDMLVLKSNYITQQKEMVKREVERAVNYIEYRKRRTEEDLKANLRMRVYEAVAIAQGIYEKYATGDNDTEVKKLIREALRPLRFNKGRGYFFIYDIKGNNVLLPINPELEGQNLNDLQDSSGRYSIRRAVKVVTASGEGFLDWSWYRPGEQGEMKDKIGFVKEFKPLRWWIGTGEYLDDFVNEVQKETLQWVNNIRYGKDGYVFVYDYNAVTLAHYKPQNIGVNQWAFHDANGVPVVRELIRIAREENGGFLEYVGTIRPLTGLPAAKISYAGKVDDWDWMVGAGVYIDSINLTLEEKKEELMARITHHMWVALSVLMICLMLIFFLSRYVAGAISGNINRFTDFFQQAATDSVKVESEAIHFREFRRLADAANMMVDERNIAEAKLEKAQEQLLRSRKMEALGVLAGGVAHDLNNVLSGMIGYPDLILNTLPDGSPQRKFILTIKESGRKAADIVDDLLTLARRGVARRMVLDLNNLVEQHLRSPEHNHTLEEHDGLKVEVNLAPDLLKIKGSPVHLEKSLMNLINNAAEAQSDGGWIGVCTENRYIDKEFSGFQKINEGEYVVLRVSDKGVGIAEYDLEHIFEPFFSKKKLGRSGTGLGMAVVWGTVQDHDGFINVITSEGEGTTFELYFHATREDVLEKIRKPESSYYQGNGERILVLDDVREQRELAVAILERLGYEIITVADGEEAVACIRQNHIDLVVLDMILEDPAMDGLETYRRIIEIEPNQKAIVASGYAETERVKAVLALGACQYVKKPYTVERIGMAIKKALSR